MANISYGYFDDENYNTLKYIQELENNILPKKLNEHKLKRINQSDIKGECCETHFLDKLKKNIGEDKMIFKFQDGGNMYYEHETDDSIKLKNKRYDFIMENQDKILDHIKLDLQRDNGLSESTIAGVALYLARGWTVTPQLSAKMHTFDRGFKLPETLPPGFPDKLKEIAYEASKMQLEEFDNHEKWDSKKNRRKALKKQMELFSK